MLKLNSFIHSEDGAVTVDWVVLTATVIGLGLVVAATIAAGTTNVSGGLTASLNNSTVRTLDMPF